MASNGFKNLTPNYFFSLFSIEQLNLRRNEIYFIEIDTFQNLNKLLFLDLSKNLLTRIEANIFNDLKNLKTLSLKAVTFNL
jgi:Leucine-rich repeat (LRR) protein